MVLYEGNLLGIECAKEGRWQFVLVCMCLSYGEDELYERFEQVVRGALLGFRPEQVLGLEELLSLRRYSHGEVYLADDLRAVVGCEPICCHLVLQFLLQYVAVK